MRQELETRCPDGVFLRSLSHDDVAVAMASADVFLFPSTTDTLGNVVLEAQASGLPVIVSDRGGPKEHMIANGTGMVCSADDAESFAAAIVRLITQPALRTSMSSAARALAATRNWPRSLSPLFGAWRRAAEARAPLPVRAVATSASSRFRRAYRSDSQTESAITPTLNTRPTSID
jgi:glycosyltransferase involved in cell wall biosynthesis